MAAPLIMVLAGLLGLESPGTVVPPAASPQPASTRELARLCRRADPEAPGVGLVAELRGGAVRYEDQDMVLERTIPDDVDPVVRRRLVDASRRELSAIASCVRREARARPYQRPWHGRLYSRSGSWSETAATPRLRGYFPDDRDGMGRPYYLHERTIFWDSERRRLLAFPDFLDPRRRRDFEALVCRRLSGHPQPGARAMRCPGLAGINLELLARHCLDPRLIARIRLWVPEPRVGGDDQPRSDYAIHLDSADFIPLLAPELRSAFGVQKAGTCPPVV